MIKVKKLLAGILGVALLLNVAGPMQVKAAGPALDVSVPDNKVLTYKYNEAQDFVINVKNTGDVPLTNITISPKLRNNSDKWPFKTEYQSYAGKIEALEAGGTGNVTFSFTERDDIPSKRFELAFDVLAFDEAGNQVVTSERIFYVNTTAKPEDKKEENKEEGKEENKGNGSQGNSGGSGSSGGDGSWGAGAGGVDNGAASYSGGGGESSGSGSVPRVIVTGFSTNPAQVKAGSNFTLTIHLKNTSKATKVKNMLFELSAPTEGNEQTAAPAFLPASGSNSIYLEGIGAGGTADIAIQLNAKADLVQKPYGIDLSMKYEDGSAAQIEAGSSVSIPVKQEARFEFSEFEMTPETIAVGEEANVSCSLYNLGRIKLYNVKATFEGKGIKKEELFIGNVEPGATASIDAMLEGKEVTQGSQKIKMTLSYEDEAGAATKTEKELQMEVTEPVEDMAMAGMPMEEESKGLPIIPIIAVVGAAAVVGIILLLRRKRRNLLLSEEEEGLLDELDGPSEDE